MPSPAAAVKEGSNSTSRASFAARRVSKSGWAMITGGGNRDKSNAGVVAMDAMDVGTGASMTCF
jgi:hypothetical protein